MGGGLALALSGPLSARHLEQFGQPLGCGAQVKDKRKILKSAGRAGKRARSCNCKHRLGSPHATRGETARERADGRCDVNLPPEYFHASNRWGFHQNVGVLPGAWLGCCPTTGWASVTCAVNQRSREWLGTKPSHLHRSMYGEEGEGAKIPSNETIAQLFREEAKG